MDKKVVEQELKKGWEATSQLRSLLLPTAGLSEEERNQYLNNERVMTLMHDYSKIILNSFDTSISICKNIAHSMEMQAPIGQTTKACPPKPRLRTISTPDLTPDGYTWRKYGQKSILNTKHPREYYRCAYKEDQKCQATKHVQKKSDNPIKYSITYHGDHTCQPLLNNNNAPSFNMLDSFEKDTTNFISFESKNPMPLPKQELNPIAFDTSSFSNDPICNPSSSATNDHPLSRLLDSTTMTESSLLDASACFDHSDKLFSPRAYMSQSYMASSATEAAMDYNFIGSNCFDMSGALQDLPLWD